MGFWTSAELPWDSVCDVVHLEWNPELPDPNWPDDVELDEDELVFMLDGEDLYVIDGAEDADEEEKAKKKGKKAKKKAKKDKAGKKKDKKPKKKGKKK